jgi:hypothetical protein
MLRRLPVPENPPPAGTLVSGGLFVSKFLVRSFRPAISLVEALSVFGLGLRK